MSNPTLSIRLSTEADLPAMRCIFTQAKEKMRAAGNMHQWTGNYPSDEQLRMDIQRGFSYLMERDGQPVATFVLALCQDPTYSHIYEGKWLNEDLPYGTIHRIASLHGQHGILKEVLRWAEGKTRNLRIDTHRDNLPMQHLLLKYGFTYCGIIYLLNGDERLAYQRLE